MMTSGKLLELVRGYFPDRAKTIGEHLDKELGLYSLASGKVIYLIASDLDLDSDGSGLPGDSTSQSETSLRDANGNSINANEVPYFVLPGHWGHGVALGDYGVIFTGTHFAYFICGDIGPTKKISEGSLELFRRLGAERVQHGHAVDASLDQMVRVLLFPGSGSKVFVSVADIEAKGQALVSGL